MKCSFRAHPSYGAPHLCKRVDSANTLLARKTRSEAMAMEINPWGRPQAWVEPDEFDRFDVQPPTAPAADTGATASEAALASLPF